MSMTADPRPLAPLDPSASDAGSISPVDTSAVKGWRRSVAIGVVLALVAALAPRPAFAADSDLDDDEEEEDVAPSHASRKQPAPLPAWAKKANRKRRAKNKERAIEERAARGVVVIEHAGKPIALGAVLSGDGRILTALSPLGAGNDLDARFVDGSRVHIKVGHHDRMWDLALVVPQTGRWDDGLTASSRDPVREDAKIHAFTGRRGKVAVVPMVLKSHRELLGGDEKTLDDTIEIGSRVAPSDMGGPVIDEEGRVVAIVGHGCMPKENRPCAAVPFGAPIHAIKAFLRTVPATAVQPSAWLGVRGVTEGSGPAKGVRITAVQPDSPAKEAELKSGDVILAVGGVPVTTPDELAEVVRGQGVGQKVRLMLFSGGKYHRRSVVLGPTPEPKTSGAAADLPPPEKAPLPATRRPRRGRGPKRR